MIVSEGAMKARLAKNVIVIECLCLFLAVCSGPAAIADDLQLKAKANGASKVVHANGYPLMIEVAISDPIAANELLDSIARGGARPTKRTTLGLPGAPFYQQVKLFANGQPLPVHLLKESKENLSAATAIDGNHSAHVYFGTDSYSTTGDAEIFAQYTPTEDLKFKAVSARVIPAGAATLTDAQKISANYNAANYFIMDGKYDAAKPYIKALEPLTPQVAATLNAEGSFESGSYTDARAFCLKALQLERKKADSGPGEPPLYLLGLLAKIDEKLFPAP